MLKKFFILLLLCSPAMADVTVNVPNTYNENAVTISVSGNYMSLPNNAQFEMEWYDAAFYYQTPSNDPNYERILVTARTGSQLLVQRGYDGTSPHGHVQGSSNFQRLNMQSGWASPTWTPTFTKSPTNTPGGPTDTFTPTPAPVTVAVSITNWSYPTAIANYVVIPLGTQTPTATPPGPYPTFPPVQAIQYAVTGTITPIPVHEQSWATPVPYFTAVPQFTQVNGYLAIQPVAWAVTGTITPVPVAIQVWATPVPYFTFVPQFTQIPAISGFATSAGQTVNIGNTGTVALTAGQTIAIGNTGTVALTAGQTINIGNTGIVAFSAGQTVLDTAISIPVTAIATAVAASVTFQGAASATRSASVTLGDFTKPNDCRIGHFVFDVTTVTGSGIFTFAIDGKDPVSAKYYNIGTSANVSTVSTNIYKVGVGLTAAANLVFNDVLPPIYRIRLTLISGTSQASSVGVNYTN